jgi:hypothetical protein
MNEERWYEDWKRRRRQEPPPVGFAERVMAAVGAAEIERRSALAAMLLAVWSWRASRIGVCTLAAAACLFRLAHVVAIFVVW